MGLHLAAGSLIREIIVAMETISPMDTMAFWRTLRTLASKDQ